MKNFWILIMTFILTTCGQDNDAQNNLMESEEYLKNNLSNDGVIAIKPGLQYLVMKSGTGKTPTLSDTITADFHGTLKDGSVFWSSIDIGEPLTIQLSQLIPGCQKAISLMQEGDFWRVFIHPSMAYGEEGRPTIPPNSALTFDIKLHAIK